MMTKVDHEAKAHRRAEKNAEEERLNLAKVLVVLCAAKRPLRTPLIAKLAGVAEEKTRRVIAALCASQHAERQGQTTQISPAGRAYARVHGVAAGKGVVPRFKPKAIQPEESYAVRRARQLLGQDFEAETVARMVGLEVDVVAGLAPVATKPEKDARLTDVPRRIHGPAPARSLDDHTRSGETMAW